MNFDTMTHGIQEALASSGQIAKEKLHTDISILHLWKSLLGTGDSFLSRIYERAGVTMQDLMRVDRRQIKRYSCRRGGGYPIWKVFLQGYSSASTG